MIRIDYGAFIECCSLISADIPTSVSSIGDGAFERCSSLESVTISASTTDISAHAFARCGALAAVIIKPAAGNTTGDVNVVEGASTWGELAGNVIADDPNEDYSGDDAPPPTTIVRVWAPDRIIKFAGPFAAEPRLDTDVGIATAVSKLILTKAFRLILVTDGGIRIVTLVTISLSTPHSRHESCPSPEARSG